MIDLHKLEIFVLVAREGSFSAAAEHLLMTQSGVSQHMHDLEAHFGTRLFERNRRGVSLTPAGVTLNRYAQQILSLVAEAEQQITDIDHLEHGQITLGATPGISVYLLPEWMREFRERYPRLTVSLQTGVTAQVIASLRSGQIELGLVEGELDEAAQRTMGVAILAHVPQYVVIGQKHAWWERQSIALRELDGQSMIMRPHNSQTRRWLDETLAAHNIRPRISAEFDNVESIKRSVMSGVCLTILPEYDVAQERDLGLVRLIPLEGELLTRTLKLLWLRDRPLSPIATAFIRHLSAEFPVLKEVF
jgi:DNA-binding transcriptional LysR family regulator